MPSLEPRAGERYLTAAGVPVQVIEIHEGIMVLQGLASDNRYVVPAGYPLRPFKGESAAFEARLGPYLGPQAKPRGSGPQPKPLAPIIDAMLLAGGHSMRGILRELRRKASPACRGKDLGANVRARMYWFRRRGYTIDSDTLGRLKARSPHEVPGVVAAPPLGAECD